MRVLAIDPGHEQSAYCMIEDFKPFAREKVPNRLMINHLGGFLEDQNPDAIAIEWIESYGMPVGAEVFHTARWVGMLQREIEQQGRASELIGRKAVKLHLCHSARAKDSNITQALVDRFTPGQSNHGKGTKAAPGWFYGFKADIWAAYALAVYVADQRAEVL